jgi:hypothetical protein
MFPPGSASGERASESAISRGVANDCRRLRLFLWRFLFLRVPFPASGCSWFDAAPERLLAVEAALSRASVEAMAGWEAGFEDRGRCSSRQISLGNRCVGLVH